MHAKQQPSNCSSASTSADDHHESSIPDEPLPQPEPTAHAEEGLPPGEYDSDLEEPLFPETDPLYDEHADSEDEAWVREHILKRPRAMQTEGERRKEAGSEGDQSVSCPCCFGLLSMQCQAHETFEGQFRAMFVNNCQIVRGERLTIQENGRTIPRRKREFYRAVACGSCGTEVAVLDEDDVYHFCNVLY